MKTPKQFDYDLWTTEENGNKKYWVRVKSTGEVSEVDIETMRFLRCEEKALRRELENLSQNSPLSLDYIKDDETNNGWMADEKDVVNELLFGLEEKAFMETLTEKQKDVFLNCMKNGVNAVQYANAIGVHFTTVYESINAIRKKYKKFFE